MKKPKRYLGLWLTICLAFASNASISESRVAPSPAAVEGQRSGYVGDANCIECHKPESESYRHTSHRLASQPANKTSILGNFLDPDNILILSDPSAAPDLPKLDFVMERKGDVATQTAMTGWGGELHRRSENIDIVTGSGVRGQTYLYWQGDRLFELPVSYWTDGRKWVNSPGYIDGTADFSRPVNPGCLECHATYIQAKSTDPATNAYVKDSLVTGIGCETCHGPGAEHAAKYAHLSQSHIPQGDTKILNPAHFSRDLQVDACAVCHSGTQRTSLQPAFSFIPGKRLADYFSPLPEAALEHPDVHGNQVGLLKRSRCFQESSTLTCSTCHNAHSPEQAAASYSAKCLTCHRWQSCGVSKSLGQSISQNCIGCHMPVEKTKLIVSETAGATLRASMRNHWIKVYQSTGKLTPPGL